VSPVDSGNGFGTRVFWTAVIPDSDVQIDLGSGRAEMHIRDLPELDYYSPAGLGDLASLGATWQTGYFDSIVSIDVVWSGPVTRRVNVRDAANGFAGTFNENQASVRWSASSDSGFSFVSEVGSFASSVPEVPGVNGVTVPLNFFAQIGQERNGVFFPGGANTGVSSVSSRDAVALLADEAGNAAGPRWTVVGEQQARADQLRPPSVAPVRSVSVTSKAVTTEISPKRAVLSHNPDRFFANWDGGFALDDLGDSGFTWAFEREV
jgi:hypothetical protein